jgi:beta-lactam-binding protein with PASTA domain/predicted Ser/Thr protein kinase
MAEVPTLLGGRYEVGELLGRGGMAEVHRGYDTRLSRDVAVKLLRSELARDATFLSRFRREAQSAASLNHASIVAIYDHGEDHVHVESGGAEVNVPYIIMEYVDGRTLRELLNERGQLEPTEAIRITEGVLDALAYSHRQGIVHRDIKPANVMIGEDGAVKVMDFGIARAMTDASATVTATQAVIGTAQYLSPEQAQGQPVDERSDLYSTGCMLFELLTGQPPFRGESPVAIAYQHVGEQPPPPSRFAEGVSSDLDAVVLHALAKPREERYQDAGEFRADLMAVRLGRPISPAARGSAAALAGAALAGAAVAGATEALPVTDESATQAYLPPAVPPPTGDTFPPVGDEVDEERRRPAMIVLLTIAVLAALGLLGWGLYAAFGGNDTPQVTVPDVVGVPLQTAEVELTRAGLQFEVTTEASDSVPKDEVISQDPSAGTEVDEQSTVALAVSAGPEAVEVPDVRGLSLDEARGVLEDVGLSVGKISKSDDPDAEQDEVISSDPAGGTEAEPGSKVNLEVGTGRVKVPNVVGMTQSAAQNALSQAGLEYETSFQQTDNAKEGTVIGQDPNDGAPVDQGSTVKIVIAQAPAPTVTATTVTPTPTSSPTDSPSDSGSPTSSTTSPAP